MTDPAATRHLTLRRLFPAIFWAVLIFIASSIPSDDIPSAPIFKFDKVIHLSIYFVFALLVYRGLADQHASTGEPSRASWLTLLIIGLYGASDEFHQFFVPGRSMDLFDWIADVGGGVLCIAVVVFLARRRARMSERG